MLTCPNLDIYSVVQKSKTISSEHEKLLQIRCLGFFLWHFHHPCNNRGYNNVIIEERLISFGEPCVFSQLTPTSVPCLGTCSLTKNGSRWVMCDSWFEVEAVNPVTRLAAAARLSFNMCAPQCSHMKTVYLLPTKEAWTENSTDGSGFMNDAKRFSCFDFFFSHTFSVLSKGLIASKEFWLCHLQ